MKRKIEMVKWIDITEHIQCNPYDATPENIVFLSVGVSIGVLEDKNTKRKILRIVPTLELGDPSNNSDFIDIPIENVLERRTILEVEIKHG